MYIPKTRRDHDEVIVAVGSRKVRSARTEKEHARCSYVATQPLGKAVYLWGNDVLSCCSSH